MGHLPFNTFVIVSSSSLGYFNFIISILLYFLGLGVVYAPGELLQNKSCHPCHVSLGAFKTLNIFSAFQGDATYSPKHTLSVDRTACAHQS